MKSVLKFFCIFTKLSIFPLLQILNFCAEELAKIILCITPLQVKFTVKIITEVGICIVFEVEPLIVV